MAKKFEKYVRTSDGVVWRLETARPEWANTYRTHGALNCAAWDMEEVHGALVKASESDWNKQEETFKNLIS